MPRWPWPSAVSIPPFSEIFDRGGIDENEFFAWFTAWPGKSSRKPPGIRPCRKAR